MILQRQDFHHPWMFFSLHNLFGDLEQEALDLSCSYTQGEAYGSDSCLFLASIAKSNYSIALNLADSLYISF